MNKYLGVQILSLTSYEVVEDIMKRYIPTMVIFGESDGIRQLVEITFWQASKYYILCQLSGWYYPYKMAISVCRTRRPDPTNHKRRNLERPCIKRCGFQVNRTQLGGMIYFIFIYSHVDFFSTWLWNKKDPLRKMAIKLLNNNFELRSLLESFFIGEYLTRIHIIQCDMSEIQENLIWEWDENVFCFIHNIIMHLSGGADDL